MSLILVTGGAGYIGSHTVVELANAGHSVLIIDNLSNSAPTAIDGIAKIIGYRPTFIQADCANYQQMRDIFATYPQIDGVLHFAAFKAVNESVHKPIEYYRNNLQSIINLLDLLRGDTAKFFVFSSSCSVYGQPDQLPVTELTPCKPATSPYGNTKKIGEEIIRDSVAAHPNIRAVSLRYFNPIGAHPSAIIGEHPNGTPDNLIPYITQTAAGLHNKLQIFGGDYQTPDGTAIRDYFHVVDLARAHVLALNHIMLNNNNLNYDVFNVGSGSGFTVLQIVQAFERVTGKKINYQIVKRREGDVEKVWADTTKAQRILNWTTNSTLEQALLTAWNWEKNLYQKK